MVGSCLVVTGWIMFGEWIMFGGWINHISNNADVGQLFDAFGCTCVFHLRSCEIARPVYLVSGCLL